MSEFLPEGFDEKPDTGYLKKVISSAGKLDPEERAMWQRFNASVSELTPEFKAWLTNFILVEVTGELAGTIASISSLEADRALVRITAPQTYGSAGGSGSNLAWASQVYARPSAMHSVSVNNDRITIARAGIYLIQATVKWAANAVGNRGIILGKNANPFHQSSRAAANPTGGEMSSVSFTMFDQAAAGDYYFLNGYQTSGGNLDVVVSDGGIGGSTEFGVIRLAAA